MNGFSSHGLEEDAFSENGAFSSGLKTFDAFPKTKPSYTRRTTSGGYATILLVLVSALLSLSELRRWYGGSETQQFSVEKGVSHQLQINLDAVVAMKCPDLHINVQDAAGDRILAGDLLNRHPTSWTMWADPRRLQKQKVNGDSAEREEQEEEDTHVGHVLAHARKWGKKFPKTPKTPRGHVDDACRIFGSLEGNKVQGDFHITARGHGYMALGEHLSHDAFNFSHLINELSFGPLYPSLLNPLDQTISVTEHHFNRFQYYLSVVPTIYTRSRNPKLPTHADPGAQAALQRLYSHETILTNQYAVTSQSQPVPENGVPGIFFKFDIEPILLTIMQTRGGFLALVVRIVNVVSGILVGGGWMYQLWDWASENLSARGRRRRGSGHGMLHGGKAGYGDGEEGGGSH